MTLIKSHTYTINLINVQYFRDFAGGTIFRMNDDKAIKITCPYDVVIHQLAGSMTHESYAVKVIKLNY